MNTYVSQYEPSQLAWVVHEGGREGRDHLGDVGAANSWSRDEDAASVVNRGRRLQHRVGDALLSALGLQLRERVARRAARQREDRRPSAAKVHPVRACVVRGGAGRGVCEGEAKERLGRGERERKGEACARGADDGGLVGR